MRGERLKGLLVLTVIIIVLLSFSIFAQQDSDVDGVLDEVDMCDSTNVEEGLPIAQNKEYLGCSCSQIQEKLGDYHCYDVLCSPNRPFSIRDRTYSSRLVACDQDYCINSTLYDFPSITSIPCVDGKEVDLNCAVVIKEDAAECINNSIAQYDYVTKEELRPLGLSLLDDFEKLQKRAYDLSTNDPIIKSGLGISSENIFFEQSKKTMDVVIIEKNTEIEVKEVGNTKRTIITKTIKLESENYKKIKKLYVFEELPRGAKLVNSDVIASPEVILQEEGPVLLVWQIDDFEDTFEVSYQVNKQFVGETNTLLIAKEVKDTTWKLMFIPLALIIIIISIFLYVSEKSVPKRKKIFKER
ncbi:MAG: hypothetical protein ACP5N2_01335 [Candidatus Nanoarchaeia archaeon]